MLTRIATTLSRQATPRNIIGLLLAVLACNAFPLPHVLQTLERLSGGSRPLDLLLYYSPEQAHAVLKAFTAEGRTLYCTFALTVDVVYPFCYAGLLGLLIARTFRIAAVSSRRLRLLSTVPLGALLFDLLENACLAVLAWRFPWQSEPLARLASACTSLKWTFVAISILILLAGLLHAVATRRPRS